MSNPVERGWLAAAIAVLVTTLFVMTTTLVPIRSDNDCWWHVKTGQYIVEHGLPTHDVFSYTAADHEWHNHEWLSQVAFHAAFRAGEATGLGGWRGVIVFTGLIVWLATMGVLLLAQRLSGDWWIALLVAVACVAIGRRMFYARPPVITNLMLVMQLCLLVAVDEGWLRRRWLALLVPGIALWTNLHGGWMAGGVILAAWMAGQAMADARVARLLPRLPLESPRVVVALPWMAALGLATLVATMVNPYTWHLYKLPGRVLGDRQLVESIGELASPNFYHVVDFELLVLGAGVLALLVRFRPRFWELAVYLFFLHQAFQHVRHLSLFSIMMVPLTARLLAAAAMQARAALEADGAAAIWQRGARCIAPAVAAALVAWVTINPREGGLVSPGVASYPGRNMQFLAMEDGYVRERFPAALCDFIELLEPTGNMWNENNYAGYLIWRLAPEKHRVFSDPRFDIFGGEIMRAEQQIAVGNLALLDHYDVNWLITSRTKVLSLMLEDAPAEWRKLATVPGGWEVWVRNVPGNDAMVERARAVAPMVGGVAH